MSRRLPLVLRALIMLLVLGAAPCLAHSPTPLMLSLKGGSDVDVRPYTLMSQQPTDSTLAQIRDLPLTDWHRASQQDFLGIGAEGLWYHFELMQDDSGEHPWLLEFDNPDIDRLEIYHFVDGRLQQRLHLGDKQPFDKRPILSTNFVYSFEMASQQQHEFWLRLDTQGSNYLPIHLWTPNQLLVHNGNIKLLKGMQLGALAAIGLFSLFMAITTGSFSYGYYAGYVLLMTLLVSSLNGIAFSHLWPNSPWLQNFMIPLLLPLVMAFNVLFSEKALQLKYHSRRWLRLCRLMTVLCLLLAIVAVVVNYRYALILDLLLVVIISLALLQISVLQAIHGSHLARLYTIACVGKTLGVVASSFMYIGWLSIPLNPQTPVMLGLTFEIMFMAAVLAVRYNEERKAKLRIQQEALLQAQRIREAKEEALLLEAESNERLERMVQERTLELEFALRELNDANRKLTEQSQQDSLTGVRNRATFDKRLQAEGRISRRQQTPLAVLMLDIDKFKSINDTYGHLAGDQTLKAIAQTLQEHLKRPGDLVSRFGGEEFAVILPNTDMHGALILAEQLRLSIAGLHVHWSDALIPLSASIGAAAAIIESDQHILELLGQADKALYQAKHQGRNQVCGYDPTLPEAVDA